MKLDSPVLRRRCAEVFGLADPNPQANGVPRPSKRPRTSNDNLQVNKAVDRIDPLSKMFMILGTGEYQGLESLCQVAR